MNEQLSIFDAIHGRRDGETFRPDRDQSRLDKQSDRVFTLMKDGAWRTKNEMEKLTGDDWASISARLRDYRKPKFGSHRVEKKYLQDGLFAYRLLVTQRAAA